MSEKRLKLNKLTISAKAAVVVVFCIFAIYSISLVFTLGWTFLQSLKGNREFFRDMMSLPKSWLFSNYFEAFSKLERNGTTFIQMFANSIWFSVGLSVVGVFAHCITGYVFAKYKFPGRGVAFSFIIFTLIIPVVGNLPSMYKIVYLLRLNDSPLYLVTALNGFGGNFLIMYAFFKGIADDYAEAAQIDGASDLYIFLRIMLPLASGPIIALSIVGIIFAWNNYETPIIFLDKMPNLASGLYYYREIIKYESNEPIYLSGALISTLPVLILVAVFGNKIMKNMTMGGIKG